MPNEELPVAIREIDNNGSKRIEIVHKSGKPSVAILVRKESEFLLLEITRPALGNQPCLEIPRGFGESETPLVDAIRELHEETGLHASSISALGRINADSGLIANTTSVYLAEVEDARVVPNSGEGILGHRWCARDEINLMIATGQISDGFTIGALKLLDCSDSSEPLESSTNEKVFGFFLSDTMENMRHTESKQLQLAIGTVGAFVVVIVTMVEKTQKFDPFGFTARYVLSAIGLFVWSMAATTKLLRYRAWKEHYALKVRELVGSYYSPAAPVIYAPIRKSSRNGKVDLRRRLLGDESLTTLCLVLTILAAGFVAMSAGHAIVQSDNSPYIKAMLHFVLATGFVLIARQIRQSVRFVIS